MRFEPILGCLPTDQTQAQDYHHRWLLVDEQGQLLSGHHLVGLNQVQVTLKLGSLVIKAPGMMRLDIPLDVIEDDDSVRRTLHTAGQSFDVVDEGDLAAAWFANVCGQPCRLVKIHPDSVVKPFNPQSLLMP